MGAACSQQPAHHTGPAGHNVCIRADECRSQVNGRVCAQGESVAHTTRMAVRVCSPMCCAHFQRRCAAAAVTILPDKEQPPQGFTPAHAHTAGCAYASGGRAAAQQAGGWVVREGGGLWW